MDGLGFFLLMFILIFHDEIENLFKSWIELNKSKREYYERIKPSKPNKN